MDEFSSIILSVFRYVAVYPLLLFAGLIDGGTIFMVYVTFFYLAFHLFIQFNLSINEEILALDRRSIFFILMMLFILVLFLVFQKNGLPSTQAFNLRNIYKVRSEYQSSPVLTLIKSFVIYFAIPWMLIFYRSFGFLLSIICATFIFMSSGGKLFLAMTLFVSVCVYLCKYGKITYVRLVLVLPVLISMLCYINQVQFVAHYLFFRPFVVPAWFSVEYYNYALENGFYFYTDHFFSGLFAQKIDVPVTVGWYIYPNSGTYANVGVMGYSFFNLGFFFLIEVLLISLAFLLIKSVWRYAKTVEVQQLCLTIAITLSVYIGTTNILTLLKTRMFLVGILILLILYGARRRVK